MRAAFFLGWLMMLGAFAAASAESIARGMANQHMFFMPAHELWRALWPASYIFFEARILSLAPVTWDPFILTLLTPPAYVLLGVPGAILAWLCRPEHRLSPEEERDFQQQEASLFLFDELAREAKIWSRETGEDPRGDDRLPSHELIDQFENGPDPADAEFLRDLDRRLPPVK